MPASISRFGIVGLGKMGGGIALSAIGHGFSVAALDTHPISDEMQRAGVKPAGDIAGLVRLLTPPRLIMLYVPAGPPVDTLLDQLLTLLDKGDVVADGGNSYWGDSIRRHARAKQHGIAFASLRSPMAISTSAAPAPATSSSSCTTASNLACCRRSAKAWSC